MLEQPLNFYGKILTHPPFLGNFENSQGVFQLWKNSHEHELPELISSTNSLVQETDYGLHRSNESNDFVR